VTRDRGRAPRPVSLHTHNQFCDGEGRMEDYVRAAIDRGVPAFGASSHSPVPWPTTYAMAVEALPAYHAEVDRLRAQYGEQIEVYRGLELDYCTGLDAFYREHIWPKGFDYVIGSVHHIGELDELPWCFETTEAIFCDGLDRLYQGDTRRLVTDYYALVREVAALPGVRIIGHLDRIKLYNAGDRFFREDEGWCVAAMEETLAALRRAEVVVELNTAGWRKPNDSPYPSAWIARRCAELGIVMCLSADAHSPEHITFEYDRGAAVLHAAGHAHLAALRDGRWVRDPLTLP
jgi:histidinol-phosphatase (PHP family)